MLRLYDDLASGNGYKVRWTLARLGVPCEWVGKDIFGGETRTPEFLALNPNGRIPLLALEDGTHLAESNAIVWYLADGSALIPDGRLARAQVLQWQFFEQYTHEPSVAVAHSIACRLPVDHPSRARLPELMEKGHAALGVLEAGLEGRDWLVGEGCTLADVSLYAYTHTAAETGFAMERFPNIGAWLERFAAQPGHVPADWRPTSPAA